MLRDVTNTTKCKQWSDKLMCLAIETVKNGFTISQAALMHGIPCTTLYDRMSDRESHGVNPAPKPYQSKCEGKNLSNFLVQASKVGYGKSTQQVKVLAVNTAIDKGLLISDSKLSNEW